MYHRGRTGRIDLKPILLLTLGFLFSWMYIAKGFFKESYFGVFALVDGTMLYCFLLVMVVALSVVFSLAGIMRSALTRWRRRVPLLSVAGSLCLFLPQAFSGLLGGGALLALALACLLVFALAFVALFLSWAREVRDLMFSMGPNFVVTLALTAMALTYVIVPSNLNHSDLRLIVPVGSLIASGLCYALYVRCIPDAPVDRSGEGNVLSKSDSRCSSGIVILALLVLVINSISYVEVFLPDYHVISQESALSYALPIVLSFFLALIAVQSKNTPFFKNRTFVHVCLGFLAFVFLALFFVVFVLAIQENFCFEVMYLFRRLTKILFMVIFLVLVYQEDLSVVNVLGVGYIAPLFIPTLAANVARMILSAYDPLLLGTLGNYAVGYALLFGFCLVLCLIVACVMFVNGSVAKMAFSPKEDGAVERGKRGDICQRIGDEYGLTQRERDVLYCLSLGYSMKRTSETLYISTSTVHAHTATVYRKLGVHSRQEVIDMIESAAK